MRYRHLLRGVLPSILMLLAAVSTAQAQDCTGTGRYIFRLRPRLIEFPTPQVADFNAGWILAPVSEILVVPLGRANRSWEICLSADSPTMGSGKPVSDIEFLQPGTGTWIPLSTTDQLFAMGDGRQWIHRIDVQFRVALDWIQDVPGRYETDFTARVARN